MKGAPLFLYELNATSSYFLLIGKVGQEHLLIIKGREELIDCLTLLQGFHPPLFSTSYDGATVASSHISRKYSSSDRYAFFLC